MPKTTTQYLSFSVSHLFLFYYREEHISFFCLPLSFSYQYMVWLNYTMFERPVKNGAELSASSPFLRRSFSSSFRTRGCSNTLLMYGSRRAKARTIGKKLPNKLMIPKPSTSMPILGHRAKTRTIPRKKQMVPGSLSLFEKKLRVRETPINRGNPLMNSKFPIARSPPSKKRSMPRNVRTAPDAQSPIPIFFFSSRPVVKKPRFIISARACSVEISYSALEYRYRGVDQHK
mmetsp:Transcript_29291/g.75491  ORF Transcript_29291/g.75491 Transcript_29291/m.75491 type:complete len:231 (-) Transcript_29291:104-796(-)